MENLGEKVIFIVGSPRSGTTWLQKLIASHDGYFTAQESDIFIAFFRPVIDYYNYTLTDPSGRGGTGLPCYLEKDEFRLLLADIFYTIISKLANYSEEKIFVEKTPSHALCIDKIHWVLPRAKFIHIIRDPRDVVASMIAASKTWGKDWAPKNLLSAALMWKRHVKAAQFHFGNLPDEIKYQVRYEDLNISPVTTLHDIFKFLGSNLSEERIIKIIEKSKIQVIHKYGEFSKKTSDIVEEPSGFVRKGKANSWREDIGLFRGLMIYLLIYSDLRSLGYSWKN